MVSSQFKQFKEGEPWRKGLSRFSVRMNFKKIGCFSFLKQVSYGLIFLF